MSLKEPFYKMKLAEQIALDESEMQQLHEKLKEYQEYVKEIANIKNKFIGEGTQYHGVLDMWKNDLDAIFLVAERLAK